MRFSKGIASCRRDVFGQGKSDCARLIQHLGDAATFKGCIVKQISLMVLLAYIIVSSIGLGRADEPKVPIPAKEKLPRVPEGFEISVFAGEPVLSKNTSNDETLRFPGLSWRCC